MLRASSTGSPALDAATVRITGTSSQLATSTSPTRPRPGIRRRAETTIATNAISSSTPVRISVGVPVAVRWKFGGIPAEASVLAA